MKHANILFALAGVFLTSSAVYAKGYGTEPTPAALAAKAAGKPKLVIYAGSGIAGQYFQRAILDDERVKNLQAQYDVRHGSSAEAQSKGFKTLPTILVSSRSGAYLKHEGSFTYVEDFLAFVMAAKFGTPPAQLRGSMIR